MAGHTEIIHYVVLGEWIERSWHIVQGTQDTVQPVLVSWTVEEALYPHSQNELLILGQGFSGFQIGSHVAQAGLELTMLLGMTLNF